MGKIKLLLYCTKQPLYLVRNECDGYFYTMNKGTLNDYKNVETYNGKIVAECEFEIEEIVKLDKCISYFCRKTTLLKEKSCLTSGQLYSYLKDKNGYAIHIKNLNIFDKAKELREYTTRKPKTYETMTCDSCMENIDCKQCSYNYEYQEVIKAPQNMMKVCEWDLKDYILISIRPEWLVKILNGEKTIELRKKILKEMIAK